MSHYTTFEEIENGLRENLLRFVFKSCVWVTNVAFQLQTGLLTLQIALHLRLLQFIF
jgi:hypothetical protein